MRQTPALIWLTGLSGSGKTTLALALESYLFAAGYKTYVLDGDNLRTGLCKGLGFTELDRKENLRRAGEVAKLFLDAGLIVIGAFISPYQADRAAIKATIGSANYIEVYVKCSVAACEKRDVKGLYAQAREGRIANFTGISAPYEEPLHPTIVVDTEYQSLDECLETISRRITATISFRDSPSV